MTTVLPYVPEYVPTTERRAGEFMAQETAMHSIAISAKRIADALEKIADLYSHQQGGRVG